MNVPVVAGVVSTVIFALSAFPMLLKAARTKELQSYSLGNMLLTNAGNAIHSVYVFNLPPGPIWAMHSFYLVTTATMLVWYLRFSKAAAARVTGQKEHSPETFDAVAAQRRRREEADLLEWFGTDFETREEGVSRCGGLTG